MARKILKNKPLSEAIFELRWTLTETSPKINVDPYYKLLIGTFYEKVKSDYPHYEQLPSAAVPEEIASFVVQHRFRKSENEWPLIQIGPGIITLNDTKDYIWEDFEQRIGKLLDAFFSTYPHIESLKINSLLLRYLDSVNFDFSNNILDFLREQMKVTIQLHDNLFSNTGVKTAPENFDLRFSFPSTRPTGLMNLRFVKGKRPTKEDILVWETMVQYVGDQVPNNKKEIAEWVKEAHDLTDDWFSKIIDGELQRRFE